MSDFNFISTDGAPGAIGPYSQAVAVDGWMFCSGQIPMDPSTGDLVQGDIQAQTDQVLKNLTAGLEGAGGYFGGMNEAYARHFGEHKPARAAVAVRTLPKNVKVEIEAIVRLG